MQNHCKKISGHPNNLRQHKPTILPFEVEHRDACWPLQLQGISPHLSPGFAERSPPGWDSRQHQPGCQSTWHPAFPPRWRSQQIAHSFREPRAPRAPHDPETRFAQAVCSMFKPQASSFKHIYLCMYMCALYIIYICLSIYDVMLRTYACHTCVYIYICAYYIHVHIHIYICVYITSSAAQGGGGSFKNRKPIGRVGCCESRMAERIHWWTERWLELCFLEWLHCLQWSPHHNCWM